MILRLWKWGRTHLVCRAPPTGQVSAWSDRRPEESPVGSSGQSRTLVRGAVVRGAVISGTRAGSQAGLEAPGLWQPRPFPGPVLGTFLMEGGSSLREPLPAPGPVQCPAGRGHWADCLLRRTEAHTLADQRAGGLRQLTPSPHPDATVQTPVGGQDLRLP